MRILNSDAFGIALAVLLIALGSSCLWVPLFCAIAKVWRARTSVQVVVSGGVAVRLSNIGDPDRSSLVSRVDRLIRFIPAVVLDPSFADEQLGDAREGIDRRVSEGSGESVELSRYTTCVLIAIFTTQRARIMRVLVPLRTK